MCFSCFRQSDIETLQHLTEYPDGIADADTSPQCQKSGGRTRRPNYQCLERSTRSLSARRGPSALTAGTFRPLFQGAEICRESFGVACLPRATRATCGRESGGQVVPVRVVRPSVTRRCDTTTSANTLDGRSGNRAPRVFPTKSAEALTQGHGTEKEVGSTCAAALCRTLWPLERWHCGTIWLDGALCVIVASPDHCRNLPSFPKAVLVLSTWCLCMFPKRALPGGSPGSARGNCSAPKAASAHHLEVQHRVPSAE